MKSSTTPAIAPRLVDRDGLAALGLRRHRTQLWRDVKAGRFPAPIVVGGRRFWVLAEVEQWLADRVAERDAQIAAAAAQGAQA